MANFIQDTWYAAAWSMQIEHALFARTILNQPLIFYRTADGKPVALHDLCPHRFAPLSRGRLQGDAVECGYHGLQFDASGRCSHNPHAGRTPDQARVKTYPVAERHGLVWVWPGDPQRADPDLIPDFAHLAAPNHRTLPGSNLTGANYELLVDNLLDLSHAQFVHADFFQGSTLLDAVVTLERGADGMVQRYECPPTDAAGVTGASMAGLEGPLCQFLHVYWQAPCTVRIEAGARRPDRMDEPMVFNFGSHILTPETDRTTHYFYASTRAHRLDDADLDARMRTWQRVGFGEQDKPMIEAVQAAMGGTDLMAMKPVLLSIDAAAVSARRILQKLIESETNARSAAA